MNKKKIAIFVSDEGYGHIVRQRALISKLLIFRKKIKITIFSGKKISILKNKFKKSVSYKKINKTLGTLKDKNGNLNVLGTKKNFNNWAKNKNKWMATYKKVFEKYDIFISDFMPEVFELSNRLEKKSYGIAHFTWDWFYKKIYGQDTTYKQLLSYIQKADKIFFPPFTNKEIINKYKKKIINVNFFLSDFKKKPYKKSANKKCLIMDNGNRTMTKHIERSLKKLTKINHVDFILRKDFLSKKSKNIIKKSKNLRGISGLKRTHEFIMESDFIIARGGFNTISECLVLKKPSLLFNETSNPEIKENLKMINNEKKCSLISSKDFRDNIEKRINFFIKNEFLKLKKNLNKSKYKSNGADQVANFIIKNL